MKQKKTFLSGAVILMVAGMISKLLSASYRVPLQNLTGDTGFYIYQQVYPFLTLAWILSIYGFPAAISKILNDDRYTYLNKLKLNPLFLILLLFGAFSFSVIYFGASFFASLMGDSQMVKPIRFSAFMYLLLPFTAFLRGMFQAREDMRPSAFSQTLEQLVRVIGILVITHILLQHGKSLYDVGAGAALSSTFGAIVAFFFLCIVSLLIRKRSKKAEAGNVNAYSYVSIGKVLFSTSLIFSLNYLLLILLQMVDVFTFIPNLQQYGLSFEDAKEAKGVFDRGQPLVQLGVVFSLSLSLSLVPALSRHEATKEWMGNIKTALKYTIMLASAASIGLILVFPAVNILLFETNKGTLALQVYSLTIFFASVAMTLSVILQELGILYRQFIIFSGCIVIKFLFNLALIPYIGLLGGAIATVIALIVLCVCFYIYIKQQLKLHFAHVIRWVPFGLSLLTMTVVVLVIQALLHDLFEPETRLNYLGTTFITIVVGITTYSLSLWNYGVFTKREMASFPVRGLFRRKRR
ncbi:putative polysaccharide biosynthesis protein [Salirhabdus salicampi]|uniref:putative polysaccharide biosynthesis protein n=1 Tax=Salirhabdus salicampi TaxID=476102 RepID=UPI0020C238DC|nr:polysaccharide biosynthesis protein [Salirhabdus salicampi]MCP8618178.1 polysaccharide biosynthesis protein [Salirhabdus salicampi]